jgi:hypothetical protein
MMDDEKSLWGHYGEFAPLEDIARLEAPATVELALGACRRKLRFYFRLTNASRGCLMTSGSGSAS